MKKEDKCLHLICHNFSSQALDSVYVLKVESASFDSLCKKNKFEPKFLPEDLKFVYSYPYENQGATVHKKSFNKLFEMFENQCKDVMLNYPPPLPKSTIIFSPPVIVGEK